MVLKNFCFFLSGVLLLINKEFLSNLCVFLIVAILKRCIVKKKMVRESAIFMHLMRNAENYTQTEGCIAFVHCDMKHFYPRH